MSSELVLDYACNLESAILGFTDILINSAQQTTKTSKRRSLKLKLKVWTREISEALQQLRSLNEKIAAMYNLNINETQLLQERKYSRLSLTQLCITQYYHLSRLDGPVPVFYPIYFSNSTTFISTTAKSIKLITRHEKLVPLINFSVFYNA